MIDNLKTDLNNNLMINYQTVNLESDQLKLKKIKFYLKFVDLISKFFKSISKWDFCFAFTELKGLDHAPYQLSAIVLSRKIDGKRKIKIENFLKGTYKYSIKLIYDIEKGVQTEKTIIVNNKEYIYEFITFSSKKKLIEIDPKTFKKIFNFEFGGPRKEVL